jgi:hypothetical protein
MKCRSSSESAVWTLATVFPEYFLPQLIRATNVRMCMSGMPSLPGCFQCCFLRGSLDLDLGDAHIYGGIVGVSERNDRRARIPRCRTENLRLSSATVSNIARLRTLADLIEPSRDVDRVRAGRLRLRRSWCTVRLQRPHSCLRLRRCTYGADGTAGAGDHGRRQRFGPGAGRRGRPALPRRRASHLRARRAAGCQISRRIVKEKAT